MAPELHLAIPYNGKAVDIFAMGVALFTMVVGHPPFEHTKKSSTAYRCIAANRADLFWKFHCQNNKRNETYSDQFRDLIENMM